MSFTGIPELKESYRKLGAARFWPLMAGTVAWIAVGASLAIALDFPDAYGSQCHGRGCFFSDLLHSPALLHRHSLAEIGLFLWLWSMPALVIAAFVYAGVRKLRSTKFSINSDPQE